MKRSLIAALFVGAALGFSPAVDAAGIESHPMIGDPAPPIHLSTVSGDSLSLEDLKGNYVVMHFGTSW